MAVKSGRLSKAKARRTTKHRGSTGVTKADSPYARYRRRVGKPNGPGESGNKAGKNRTSAP